MTNPKKLIKDLLEQTSEHWNDDVGKIAGQIQRALDAGALDCLVEHLASEPPDSIRDVLVLTVYGHYLVDHHAPGVGFQRCGSLVKTWRELPVPEPPPEKATFKSRQEKEKASDTLAALKKWRWNN